MITCADCVNELKTARLADIRAGSPVALHYTSCENCKRLVHDLYHSERDLAVALDTFGFATNSSIVAENAIEATYRRRKRIGRGVRALLAIAGVGVLGIGIAIVTDDGEPSPRQRESINLECMPWEQASEIAQRFMVADEQTILLRNDGKTIVLEGYTPQVVEAASQIAVLDATACALPGAVAEPSTPQADKSGTD